MCPQGQAPVTRRSMAHAGPGLLLSRRRQADLVGEPGGYQRVEERQGALALIGVENGGVGVFAVSQDQSAAAASNLSNSSKGTRRSMF